MPTANPLEQLRRRLHAQASPAAFAALAEEHRRAGRLDEAIAVCRDGLARYPTYVSARVTLGRALLDSGDVVAAAGELEHAVAQAPDNLAAVRALEAARAACAELPAPPPLPAGDTPPASGDLLLQGSGPEAPRAPTPVDLDLGDALVHSFAAGPDAPQEFGLGPGWTIPDTDPPSAEPPALDHDAGEAPTLALHDHADAPTICFTPPPLQGEEPAGIWPVPDPPPGAPAAGQGGVPVFSWAIAAPGREDVAQHAEAVEPPRASIWDEPTIEVPVVAVDGPDLSADPAAGAPGGWDGLFADPPSEGAAPGAFAGWDAPGPGLPEPPAWSAADAPVAAGAGDLASSAFTWGLDAGEAERQPDPDPEVGGEHPPAWDVTAPDPTPAEHDVAMASAAEPTAAAAGMDPPAGGTPEVAMPAQDWAGSVASALDEVFEHARLVDADEPPTSASPLLQAAMADAAVEAALEDTAQGEDALPPALASLQRLLDNVRARRAALFTDQSS